jgi:putative glycosyltransferase (TIGR04372 family)
MKKTKFLIFIILFSPLYLMIFILRPIIFLKFGLMSVDRIGSIMDLELYMIYNKKKFNTVEIWFTSNIISNYQFLKILKRNFFLIQKFNIFFESLKLISKYFISFRKHLINSSNFSYDTKNRLNKISTKLNLSKNEIIKGKKILQKYKLKKNSKIICITCRDNEYLKKTSSIDFNYHSYRDNEVTKLIPAIKMLLKKKFIVIRMGKLVKKKININHSNFIDYPFHPMKSDFMDFYLARSCYFWIGSNNGLDELARLFRKPILMLNMAPVGLLKLGYRNSVLLSKKFKYKKKYLNLSSIFKNRIAFISDTNHYKKNRTSLIENNSHEILKSVKNILILIQNKWKMSKNKMILQKKFRKNFFYYIKKYNYNFFHGSPKAILCDNFIKKNSWLLK